MKRVFSLVFLSGFFLASIFIGQVSAQSLISVQPQNDTICDGFDDACFNVIPATGNILSGSFGRKLTMTPNSSCLVNTTDLDNEADLSILKTDSPDPVIAGEVLTYSITINNNGPSDAENVTVVDVVPTGLTINRTSATHGSWTAPNWEVGNLALNECAILTIIATVGNDVTGSLSNTATVSSDTPDPDDTNNSVTEVTTVTTLADLSITKTGSLDSVIIGQNLSYTITVTNNGLSFAQDVEVTDELPTDLVIVSVAPSVGIWNSPTWTIDTMANDASETLTIVATVNSTIPGSLSNTATVTSTTPDSVTGNNTETELTIIIDYPKANNDSSLDNTPKVDVTMEILRNDCLQDGSTPDPGDVTVDIDSLTTGIQDTLIVSGEGIWIYSTETGELIFGPEIGITDNPTDITYELTEKATGLSNNAKVHVEYGCLEATVYAGSDKEICENKPYQILDADARNYANLMWTNSGNGTFNCDTILAPIYTPSALDTVSGSDTLALTVTPMGSNCTPVSDSIILTLQRLPIVNAGNDTIICANDTLILKGICDNCDSLRWTSSGTGTFVHDITLNAQYIPNLENINAVSDTLTLTGYPMAPCSEDTVSEIIITINPSPKVTISGPEKVCKNSYNVEYSATERDKFVYEWSDPKNGAINKINENKCFVNWAKEPEGTEGEIKLLTTNDAGCKSKNHFSVIFLEHTAPDTNSIVPKPRDVVEPLDTIPFVLICTIDDSGYQYQYHWYENGVPIDTTGAPDPTLKFYYRGPGENIKENTTYTVLVRLVVDGEIVCETESFEYKYTRPNKSMLFDPTDIFIIYPNPSPGQFTISLNEENIPKNFEYCELRIIDIAGRVVIQDKPNSIKHTILLNNIEEGIYFVEILVPGTQRQIKKVIIY